MRRTGLARDEDHAARKLASILAEPNFAPQISSIMNDQPPPEKLVPEPLPRWQNSKGVLLAAAVLILAFCGLLGLWLFT